MPDDNKTLHIVEIVEASEYHVYARNPEHAEMMARMLHTSSSRDESPNLHHVHVWDGEQVNPLQRNPIRRTWGVNSPGEVA